MTKLLDHVCVCKSSTELHLSVHEWDNLVTLIINVVNEAHIKVVTDGIHQI